MVAKYPPMGWNSWDCYGTAVNEEITRANADFMAKNLKQYGWEYVVVDIQWYQPDVNGHDYKPFPDIYMDEYGRCLPTPNRFPSAADGKGFKPLADYVHSLGLKFGIHIMRGLPRMAAHKRLPVYGTDATCDQIANPNSICMWNPDMYGLRAEMPEAQAYYDSIFKLYAEWGVDFVKCDDIARLYPECRREIEIISNACRNCGRDMVLSLSPGPAPVHEAEHLKKYANMWRITDDFWDKWELLKVMFDRAEEWCIHAGPGHWPDADMLPVGLLRVNCRDEGMTRFTEAEQRTMLTLWCLMRSPLMIGAEMSNMDEFTLKLLTNEKLLDALKTTYCAHPLYRTEEEIVWYAPCLDGKGAYVAAFNISDAQKTVTVDPDSVEFPYAKSTELWSGCECPLTADLPAHDAAVWFVE